LSDPYFDDVETFCSVRRCQVTFFYVSRSGLRAIQLRVFLNPAILRLVVAMAYFVFEGFQNHTARRK
jgi:hypothetical protein